MNASQRRKMHRQMIRDFPIGAKVKHKYNAWQSATVVNHHGCELLVNNDYAFWTKATNWKVVS